MWHTLGGWQVAEKTGGPHNQVLCSWAAPKQADSLREHGEEDVGNI